MLVVPKHSCSAVVTHLRLQTTPWPSNGGSTREFKPGLAIAIYSWLPTRRDSHIESVVACINTKLAPAFMIGMVVKTSVELLGYEGWSTDALLNLWLRDELASTHSELLCITRHKPPTMWLFSPFQTRPLGKALPSVLMTCTCPSLNEPDGNPSTS